MMIARRRPIRSDISTQTAGPITLPKLMIVEKPSDRLRLSPCSTKKVGTQDMKLYEPA